MRWIFFSLVVANLLLFSYYWTQPVDRDQGQASAMQPPLPTGVKQLELANVDGIAEAPTANGGSDALRHCHMLGPLPDSFAVRNVLARLKALGLTGRERQVSLPSQDEFWVYLAPLANRTLAMRKLKELQKNQIDSYVITKGELNNGISLGLYSKRELAVQTRDRVREQGYGALIKTMERNSVERWVEVSLGSMTPLTDRLKEKIQGEYQDQRWQEAACE